MVIVMVTLFMQKLNPKIIYSEYRSHLLDAMYSKNPEIGLEVAEYMDTNKFSNKGNSHKQCHNRCHNLKHKLNRKLNSLVKNAISSFFFISMLAAIKLI